MAEGLEYYNTNKIYAPPQRGYYSSALRKGLNAIPTKPQP